jgi:hypothetical protein
VAEAAATVVAAEAEDIVAEDIVEGNIAADIVADMEAATADIVGIGETDTTAHEDRTAGMEEDGRQDMVR